MSNYILIAYILTVLLGSIMSIINGWLIAGLFRVKDRAVDDQGRPALPFPFPRLFVGLFASLCWLALTIWVAATTRLALLGALLGTTALAATILVATLPIWGIKNIITGPRRIWGIIGLIVGIPFYFPLISTALEMKDFLPTFWQALRGEASLFELLIDLWDFMAIF
ncbi:MAG TPA: hypothetical protein G4O08_05165 [Anaerolineae bacterium]|nr:hypothetical protein [Anaerolineae bacterium]